MLAGTALYVRLLVYAGLSLFIINGLYVYMVVCVVYAYNLTIGFHFDYNVKIPHVEFDRNRKIQVNFVMISEQLS